MDFGWQSTQHPRAWAPGLGQAIGHNPRADDGDGPYIRLSCGQDDDEDADDDDGGEAKHE